MGESPPLSAGMLTLIAERFKALSEPARLSLLDCLRNGEHTVSELILCSGLSQANTSRHLQLLHTTGMVERRRVGVRVVYSVEDRRVYALFDLVQQQLSDVHRDPSDQDHGGVGTSSLPGSDSGRP